MIATVLPWIAVLGFFGVLLRVRVTGDPALWKRIEALETRLDEQGKNFERLMKQERDECTRKLSEMEGRIRQLQQQQNSFGNIGEGRPLQAQLHEAFKPDHSDKDKDLVGKLNKVPGRRKRG